MAEAAEEVEDGAPGKDSHRSHSFSGEFCAGSQFAVLDIPVVGHGGLCRVHPGLAGRYGGAQFAG